MSDEHNVIRVDPELFDDRKEPNYFLFANVMRPFWIGFECSAAIP
jgi:hypothetical protein